MLRKKLNIWAQIGVVPKSQGRLERWFALVRSVQVKSFGSVAFSLFLVMIVSSYLFAPSDARSLNELLSYRGSLTTASFYGSACNVGPLGPSRRMPCREEVNCFRVRWRGPIWCKLTRKVFRVSSFRSIFLLLCRCFQFVEFKLSTVGDCKIGA